MKIKILIVDDHAMVREGLRALLVLLPGFEIAEMAGNGHEAVMKTGTSSPDVVLMDYEMPNFNGIYATKEILALYPHIRILMLSTFSSKEHVMAAIRAGVHGYLPKETNIDEIAAAIRALANGNTWFKGDVAEMVTPYLIASVNKKGRHHDNNHLTDREAELVKLWVTGLTSREIAEKVSLSKRTVEVHKANIFKKLGLKNTTELVRYAIHNNLVKI